jgi:minimal PKS acyl carrier protein
MAGFTLTEFRQIVDQCYEGADAGVLDESALETEFDDLGFDSIVVYEITVRIQDDFGVAISDDELDGLTTPGAFIAFVDAKIPAAG